MSSYEPANESEKQYYGLLFQVVDAHKTGKIGVQDAVKFLTRSGLSQPQLKNIWTIAVGNKPELGMQEFTTAMRCISLAQNGEELSIGNLEATKGKQLPLPIIEGIPNQNANLVNNKINKDSPKLEQHNSSSPMPTMAQPAQSPQGNEYKDHMYVIQEATKQGYKQLFQQQPLKNGLLPGKEKKGV